jgi:hypothetical protein
MSYCRSQSFAGQLAGLLHPSGEFGFVELLVLVDVEVKNSYPRPQAADRKVPYLCLFQIQVRWKSVGAGQRQLPVQCRPRSLAPSQFVSQWVLRAAS